MVHERGTRSRERFCDYYSRRCKQCDRDYLYPYYGGQTYCNDCVFTNEDEKQLRRDIRDQRRAEREAKQCQRDTPTDRVGTRRESRF